MKVPDRIELRMDTPHRGTLYVDGEVFPWYVGEDVFVNPGGPSSVPSVTIELVALEGVTITYPDRPEATP